MTEFPTHAFFASYTAPIHRAQRPPFFMWCERDAGSLPMQMQTPHHCIVIWTICSCWNIKNTRLLGRWSEINTPPLQINTHYYTNQLFFQPPLLSIPWSQVNLFFYILKSPKRKGWIISRSLCTEFRDTTLFLVSIWRLLVVQFNFYQ